MGSALVLITENRSLAEGLRKSLRGTLVTTDSWPDSMPHDVLIVDVAAARRFTWRNLERFSREFTRPSIVLLDDGKAPREHLARVAADALVTVDEPFAQMATRVQEVAPDHAFRIAAAQITATSNIPYPLVRFLAAAFTERRDRVNVLARTLGMSQSTLRNQWRAVRSDPSMRLKDVLHGVAQVRERAGRHDANWRLDLQRFVQSISAGA